MSSSCKAVMSRSQTAGIDRSASWTQAAPCPGIHITSLDCYLGLPPTSMGPQDARWLVLLRLLRCTLVCQGSACRAEGERRLVETLVRQGRIEEAEATARDAFALCQEAGLQVPPLPVYPLNAEHYHLKLPGLPIKS